ncbi:MAG: GntR family transcriptional regulator [Breznakia sp.]
MKKIPKYLAVYNEIKKRIELDIYAIGEKLPVGDVLAEEFDTGKLTVKKGLDMLVNDGVLLSRSGYGTEVLRKPINKSKAFGPSDGLSSVLGEEHVNSEVYKFSIELPNDEVAKKLRITKRDYVYSIIRSRFLDSKPYSLEQMFMPLVIIPGLTPEHLENSVYEYIRSELNLDIQSSHLWMRGVIANAFDKEVLGIKEGSYMIEVEKIVSLSTGTPFEYSITRHVYKDFEFEAVFVDN